ncbi:MAG: hypothetical protein LBC41_11160 [Clostridiales bacterium]|jgi:hypothetical protein|nr:hypothetical protein [Clostridiales bacterium]
MNDNIWIVIWDLDNCFWDGSLLDGTVSIVEENVRLVRTLIDRGIMNSVCYRGDSEKALALLDEIGVLDCLIFPSIDTEPTPKSERIRQIIANARLRPQYALYIDDSEYNLREAAFCLPKINTARPDDIWDLESSPELYGFRDPLHVRLAQYKLAKPISQKKPGWPNIKFLLKAGIECDIVSPCSGFGDEILEACSRTPLDVTGSSLDLEKISSLLKDPSCVTGVIKAKHNYGDLGVVGFYALKSGVCEHLVFSSKLVDLQGIELWTYSQLQNPELHEKGSWVPSLEEAEAPIWINSKGAFLMDSFDAEGKPKSAPRLLVRGGEDLKRISEHVLKYLPLMTSEIMAKPTSICMTQSLDLLDDSMKSFLRQVARLDENAFSKAMFSGDFDYVLLGILPERGMSKYALRDDPSICIWMPAGSSDSRFLEQFTWRAYNDDDLDESLSYIAEHLPSHTSAVILTASEVAFKSLKSGMSNGTDLDRNEADLDRRLRYNKILEQIAAKYPNIYLLDIRSYITDESDLDGHHISQYDKSVDESLARTLLAIMGVEVYASDPAPEISPPMTLKKNVSGKSDVEIKYEANIANGIIILQVHLPRGATREFSYELMRGGVILKKQDFSLSEAFESPLPSFGYYWIRVKSKKTDEDEEYRFQTPLFDYGKTTAFNYINPGAPGFKSYTAKTLPRAFELAAEKDRALETLSAECLALLAAGESFANFFKDRGTHFINVVADQETAPLVMDSLNVSGISIRGLYTMDLPFTFGAEVGLSIFKFAPLATASLTANDTVLIACLPMPETLAQAKSAIPDEVPNFWLHDILHALSTKRFFTGTAVACAKKDVSVPLIAVRLPSARALPQPTENEKMLFQATPEKIMRLASRSMSRLPESYDGYSLAKVQETMALPPSSLGKDGVWRFEDRTGNFTNVESGYRKTHSQPLKAIGTIYLFGGAAAFGQGLSDDETIASLLQSLLALPLRVVNCSNYSSRLHAGRMMSLMKSIQFKQNDIIVVCMEDDIKAPPSVPFLYKRLEGDWIKADALPSVLDARDNAFLSVNLFSPKGALAVAKAIKDTIYDIIKLY